MRVLTLNETGPSMLSLRTELEALDLWSRTVVQVSTVDAQGGQAGCWRSHTRAWRESAACQAALVLEDDAFFEPASLLQCSAALEAVLHTPSSLAQGNLEFFLLGWSGLFQNSTLTPAGVLAAVLAEYALTLTIPPSWAAHKDAIAYAARGHAHAHAHVHAHVHAHARAHARTDVRADIRVHACAHAPLHASLTRLSMRHSRAPHAPLTPQVPRPKVQGPHPEPTLTPP